MSDYDPLGKKSPKSLPELTIGQKIDNRIEFHLKEIVRLEADKARFKPLLRFKQFDLATILSY